MVLLKEAKEVKSTVWGKLQCSKHWQYADWKTASDS